MSRQMKAGFSIEDHLQIYYGPDDSVRSGKKPLARPRDLAGPNTPAAGSTTTQGNQALEVAVEKENQSDDK